MRKIVSGKLYASILCLKSPKRLLTAISNLATNLSASSAFLRASRINDSKSILFHLLNHPYRAGNHLHLISRLRSGKEADTKTARILKHLARILKFYRIHLWGIHGADLPIIYLCVSDWVFKKHCHIKVYPHWSEWVRTLTCLKANKSKGWNLPAFFVLNFSYHSLA